MLDVCKEYKKRKAPSSGKGNGKGKGKRKGKKGNGTKRHKPNVHGAVNDHEAADDEHDDAVDEAEVDAEVEADVVCMCVYHLFLSDVCLTWS